MLADAQAAEVSEEQLAFIEAAVESGEMSFESINILTESAVRCLEVAGYEITGRQVVELTPGLQAPDYRIVGKNQSADASAADLEKESSEILACEHHHILFARDFYISQPSAREINDAALLAATDDIRECLRSRQVELPPDPKAGELVAALLEDMENSESSEWESCYPQAQVLIGP